MRVLQALRTSRGPRFTLTPALLAAMVLTLATPSASAQRAKLVEKGRDVGDGIVLYDTPYDAANTREMTFVSPTVAHPFYEIVIPMGDWTEGANATVASVTVNGAECEAYSVFVDGFSHVASGWVTRESATANNVVLAARAIWHNDADVTVEVKLTSSGTPAEHTKTFTGHAPAQGGGPAGWKHYQTLVLRETAGLDRVSEPVECSIVAETWNCGDLREELRIFEVDHDARQWTAVPFQTFGYQEYPGAPPGTEDKNYLYRPSRSIETVFLADVPAKASKLYVIVYDNPGAQALPPATSDLAVSHPGVGATVDNAFYTVKLDDRSGQIVSIQLKGRDDNPAPLITNSLTFAAHWNPDSYTDNGTWGHTFAWDPPDRTEVAANGPLMFRITNSGRMPGWTPQVHASVSYTFYAGVPYVKCSTSAEVRDPVNLNALRNGELVIDSHLVTNFVWQNRNGSLEKIRTAHGPNWQDEWGTRVDPDVRWIAMTHEADDYGIGGIVQSSIAFNPTYGEATVHRPAYYLYYHHFWATPITYFTRGWVYPFSDFQRGSNIPARVDSTYVEKMAFLPFFLQKGHGRYRAIIDASEQLKEPLVQRWGR